MKRLVLCIVALLIVMTGCENEIKIESVSVERDAIVQHEIDTEETEDLVVWVNGLVSATLIEPFRELYPEINIQIIGSDDAQGEKFTMLKKSLADGTGDYQYPDVIFVSEYAAPQFWEREAAAAFTDVYKLMDSGALLNLKTFMESDEEFDETLYEQKAMEGCQYRGGQYLMPLSYGSGNRTMLASRESLKRVGFDTSACTDAASFFKELVRIRPAAKEQGMKMLFSHVYLTVMNKMETLFYGYSPEIVDQDTGTVFPDGEKFKEFCENWKELIYSDGGEKRTVMQDNGQDVRDLMEPNALFTLQESFDYELSAMEGLCGLKVRTEPEVMQFPNSEGGHTGTIIQSAGICAKGKNHQNAWKFIKFMLSEEVQGEKYGSSGGRIPLFVGAPVRLSAQESAVAKYEEYAYQQAEKHYEEMETLSESEIESLERASTNFSEIELPSSEVYALFEENMEPYFKDKAEYEECVENLKAALVEYLEK